MDIEYIQPNNPTDEERHRMMMISLEQEKRTEDFDNLLNLLSPPRDITNILPTGACKGIRVGIIGGGAAGLSCAFELRKLGFDITIFEKQTERIGGRIYTYYFDKYKKFYGELGAMRIPASHEAVWHYINLFGLQTRPFAQLNENTLFYIRDRRARNDPRGKSVMENIYPAFNLTPRERNTPWKKLIDYALSTQLLKLSPNVRKELLQVKRRYSAEIDYLGSISIRRMLETMGLSEGAIELISGVVPSLGNIYYNSYFEHIQDQYSLDYAYRYQIDGGTVNLAIAFYNALISENPKEYNGIQVSALGKVAWKNGKTVTGIYKGEMNSRVIIEYRDELTFQSFYQNFDYVVCTIPFSSLRNVLIYPMFSSTKMQAIKELNYLPAQKTIFMCNNSFWETFDPSAPIVGGGSYTDLPIASIWYPSRSNNENFKDAQSGIYFGKHKQHSINNRPGVLIASYNQNQDAIRLGNLDSNARFISIKRQVEAVHGLPWGYLDTIVEDYKTVLWENEPGFYGGNCYFMPDQQRLFAYAAAKPEYDNKVYFAGEHVSLTHAWIQGSLQSAMMVANDVAYHCREHQRL